MTQHTALLPLPDLLTALGFNVVVLDGWDEAQGSYLWTDPLTENRAYDNEPSSFMVHHTGSTTAVPVVKNLAGVWSKANAWLGLWDGRKLYQHQPDPDNPLPATIVLTSAGPARISSGYGYWPLAEDYLFQDKRAPYWDQPNSDTARALNRYAFNLETVHRGDGSDLDPEVWNHIVGLGIALHILFGWKDRTTGHLTWTRRKLDPFFNSQRNSITPIQDAIVAGLEPIDPPIDPPEAPVNNIGRNMQYIREGDTGQDVEYWQVMSIMAHDGIEFYGTSNRTFIQNEAPQLTWKVWDEAMTAYLSEWTGRNSYGIGATERVMIELAVSEL